VSLTRAIDTRSSLLSFLSFEREKSEKKEGENRRRKRKEEKKNVASRARNREQRRRRDHQMLLKPDEKRARTISSLENRRITHHKLFRDSLRSHFVFSLSLFLYKFFSLFFR
jgi:Flp pilus assembly protein TadB